MRIAALLLLLITAGALGPLAATGGFAPVTGRVDLVRTVWSLEWGITSPGPNSTLWWPSGSCVNLTGTFSAGSEFSCWLLGTEHCNPTGGTSAACSLPSAVLVYAPFALVGAQPIQTYGCFQPCVNTLVTVQAPAHAGICAMAGAIVYQAYYHT